MIDTKLWHNKNPVCPHCFTVYDINEHEAYQLYETDHTEDVQCGNEECGKEFEVRTHVEYSFSTDIEDY